MKHYNASRSHYTTLTGLVLLCAPAISHATVRNVPAAYPNIQTAINASVAGDTVLVSPGVYSGPGNVNLDPGGKAITIKSASGPGSCTIDGGNAHQIFVIHSGETSKTVLSGFTLDHGSGYKGGAMEIIDNSSPTVSNCVFENCFADGGAGCYVELSATSAPIISNCTFLHNTATQFGGGLVYLGGSGSISNCTFVSNVAQAVNAGAGGGLYVGSNNIRVANCAFNNNGSWTGGGVQVDLNSTSSFTNCTFHANNGYGVGGGADVTNGANPAFTNCTFTNNYSPYGGGLTFDGTSGKVNGCVFDSNKADYFGGGLDGTLGVTLTNSTFTNNTAANGGGARIGGDGSVKVTDCTFDGNTASLNGGGLYADASKPTVTGCLFTNNSATTYTYGSGGGAFCSGSPIVTGCVFDGNSAVFGGGLATGGWNANNKSVIVNTVFEFNTASHLAGGLHVEGDTANITQCTFYGNLATSQAGQGDGICGQSHYTITVSDCILWDSSRGTPYSDFNTDASGVTTFQYSDFYGGAPKPGVGNIEVDPQFADAANGELFLQATSPCVNAGSIKVPNYSTLDIDGTKRNPLTPTIGAYEN